MLMILRVSGIAVVLLAVASSTVAGQSLRPTYPERVAVRSVQRAVTSFQAPDERISPEVTAGVPSSSLDGTENGILIGGAAGVLLGGVLYTFAISASESDWEAQNMLLASFLGGALGASIGGIVGSAGS